MTLIIDVIINVIFFVAKKMCNVKIIISKLYKGMGESNEKWYC